MGSENNVVIPMEIPDPAKAPVLEEEVSVVEQESPKPEKPAKSAEDGIEELRRKLEEEKAARLQVEHRARQTEEEASRYRSQAERTRADNLANAVDLASQEIDKQKVAYQKAMEAGDFAAAADAQAAIGEAAAAKVQATHARTAFEVQARERAERPAQQPQQFTPRTQAWLNDHPEVLSNPSIRQKAMLADGLARADGLAPDTDEYFQRVEGILGMQREEKAKRPEVPVAAPVSRGTAQPGADGKVRYHLSQAEKEFCEMSGLDPLEYAKNKARIQA